jgi:alpha-glucosidase
VSWWREGVLYQIYPRSFADSNGDGIGDIGGIIGKLDYLAWLGIDAIWLNPTYPSPNVDWGYDVSDYAGVHPDLGTLDDLDTLIARAARHGIRVVLDLVPNHTSNRHAWFRHRPEYYVWADAIPNDWRSVLGGGPAWEWDDVRGGYYLHNFAREQPDLDWWNDEVRDEFDDILRFWLDRGVAGFRIDVAHAIVKDRRLRDDPVDPDGPGGRRHVYSMNRPEVHDVHRRWRRLVDGYEDERLLLGEVYVLELERWARFFGNGSDTLHLAFNFALVHADLDAVRMRRIVERTERLLPVGAQACWTGSNHDKLRLATRWCGGDEALARCALLVVLGLRGTPVLYYGDELALRDGEVPPERRRDVAERTRDPGRTPMPWTRAGGWDDPWLPLLDTSRNVEDQRADPGSTLTFTRDLLALRGRSDDLRRGGYASLPSPSGVWAWRRGKATVVAVNLGSRRAEVDCPSGRIAISTPRGREGERINGRLGLDVAEGVVVG